MTECMDNSLWNLRSTCYVKQNRTARSLIPSTLARSRCVMPARVRAARSCRPVTRYQWNKKAWLRPKIHEARELVLYLLAPEEGTELSSTVYAVYMAASSNLWPLSGREPPCNELSG